MKKESHSICFIFLDQNIYLIKASQSIQKLPLDRIEVELTKLSLGRMEVSPLLENNRLWKIS